MSEWPWFVRILKGQSVADIPRTLHAIPVVVTGTLGKDNEMIADNKYTAVKDVVKLHAASDGNWNNVFTVRGELGVPTTELYKYELRMTFQANENTDARASDNISVATTDATAYYTRLLIDYGRHESGLSPFQIADSTTSIYDTVALRFDDWGAGETHEVLINCKIVKKPEGVI